MDAAVAGTVATGFRPTPSYTNSRDVTPGDVNDAISDVECLPARATARYVRLPIRLVRKAQSGA